MILIVFLFYFLQLPRHYLQFPDGFVLVYDPCDPASLDMLAYIKNDIDKNKDKKDVTYHRHIAKSIK